MYQFNAFLFRQMMNAEEGDRSFLLLFVSLDQRL